MDKFWIKKSWFITQWLLMAIMSFNLLSLLWQVMEIVTSILYLIVLFLPFLIYLIISVVQYNKPIFELTQNQLIVNSILTGREIIMLSEIRSINNLGSSIDLLLSPTRHKKIKIDYLKDREIFVNELQRLHNLSSM